MIQVCHFFDQFKKISAQEGYCIFKMLNIIFQALDVHTVALSPIDNATTLLQILYVYSAVSPKLTSGFKLPELTRVLPLCC